MVRRVQEVEMVGWMVTDCGTVSAYIPLPLSVDGTAGFRSASMAPSGRYTERVGVDFLSGRVEEASLSQQVSGRLPQPKKLNIGGKYRWSWGYW